MDSVVKNQHFISQSEQRSNSLDDSVLKKNRRIYKFDIVDRENDTVRLTRCDGVKIKSALSFGDLFSFDVLDGEKRRNLEGFFEAYEVDVSVQIEKMLHMINAGCSSVQVQPVAMKVLAAKLMGIIRNPYCIDATLQMFHTMAGVVPTDHCSWVEFQRIRDGAKPHIEIIKKEFDTTEEKYVLWLEILYLALMKNPKADGNILDSLVLGLIQSAGSACVMYICEYNNSDEYQVVLPDVGYAQGSNDPFVNIFMFNLNKRSFASFVFCDMENQDVVGVPQSMKELISSRGLGFWYCHLFNNEEMLRKFNILGVYQSRKNVYCAYDKIFGVKVLPPQLTHNVD